MKKIIIITILCAIFFQTNIYSQTIRFDKYFLDKTMRLDFYHTGLKDQENISLDVVYEEPASLVHERQLWAGSKVNLVDTLNFGKYMVKVFNLSTNQLIYSRGFSSLFGEWQTTDEAANGIYRTFHESVLFPYPKNKVQVVIAARDKKNVFRNVFSTVIDPESRFVNRERHVADLKINRVRDNGDPAKKVDIVILGDGYTPDDMKQFRNEVQHFVDLLFDEQPFKDRAKDFNVWAIEVPSL
ncbi:MAG: hypothetical protein GF353_22510, partial [Candidatus Lokiarchaeota archaeon]|nr:hypothetical protein [Candidatus Lokiarchaeota archaeon]